VIESVTLLTVAYAAVAALLLNLNLATSHAAWIKAGSVVLVTGLYVGSWFGLQGMTGWATTEPMPESFRVLWITMEEPDKTSGAAGSIFFWVRALDEAGLPVGNPRAHSVPWSEAKAEVAQAAIDRLEDGELLNGRFAPEPVAQADAQPVPEYGEQPSSAGMSGEQPAFEFLRVPPPALPAKTTPD
jgi:hypothetical protein